MTPVLFKKEIYMVELYIDNENNEKDDVALRYLFWNKSIRDTYLASVMKNNGVIPDMANANKSFIDTTGMSFAKLTTMHFYSRNDYGISYPPSIAYLYLDNEDKVHIASDDMELLRIVNNYTYSIEKFRTLKMRFSDQETIILK